MEFQIHFNQIDSWFFKESRPMDSLGNNEMQSLFPPTAYTTSGVIRSMLGEYAGIDWTQYLQGKGTHHQLNDALDLCQELGNPKQAGDLGNLQLKGCFPSFQQTPLIPAPLNLIHSQKNNQTHYAFMQISSQTYQTDLGNVRLAEISNDLRGKPLENTWLELSLFQALLKGETPKPNDARVHTAQHIFTTDPRLGIAIDTTSHTTKQGQLYQTSHIRLHQDYGLTLFAQFHEQLNPKETFIRFGSEGRQAHAQIQPNALTLPPPTPSGNEKGLILYFLTHANFNSNFIPEEIQKVTESNRTSYQGQIHGIELQIESMILGKAVREGGWDLAHHKPKPAHQLVPAGSCWYITTPDIQKAIETLHLTHIGQETQLGRGLIACGLWK